jgi:hypothetical protein
VAQSVNNKQICESIVQIKYTAERLKQSPYIKEVDRVRKKQFRPSVADLDPGSGAFLTPGSGIRNRFFRDIGSRIPDSRTICLWAYWQLIGNWILAHIFFLRHFKNSNKIEGWKKIYFVPFLCSHKFHKNVHYFNFEVLKKKIWQFSKNFRTFRSMGLGS